MVTILGTPTESGTFNYTITTTGGCGIVETTGTITVNPENTIALTSAAGTDNQSVCINNAITNITYATTGANGANFAGLPAGVSGSWAADVVTISGTPIASGTFNYTVTLTGGCGTVTANGSISVVTNNTISLTSAAGTDNQTVCISTAITNITYATTGATGATFSDLPTGVTGSWAADVVTIFGTPNVSGTFNYTVTLTGGCGTVTANGSIDVTPANTISLTSAAGTDAQTVCINNAITNITYATTGATGATFAGLPAGVTGSWTADVVTISGTPTESGTFNYTVTLTGGCGTVTANGSITVNDNHTITLTSATGTDSQTVSLYDTLTNITYSVGGGATGASITAGSLPAGVNGTFSAGTFTISGTPTTAGTFNYTVTTSGPCTTASANGTITVSATPLPTNDRKALEFDGDDDYVYVADDNNIDPSASGTIEAWIYPISFTPNAGIVFKGTASNGVSYGFRLGENLASEQNITFVLGNTDGGGTDYSVTATDKRLEAFQWYHIACVWSGTTMTIYVNGIASNDTGTFASANIRGNSDELRFGMQEVDDVYFQGVIDEVRFWSTARAEADIRANMCKKLDGSETGLGGYWRFDENNSVVVGDWAGNGNIGFVENATRICSQAPIGDDSAFCDYNAATFTVSLGFGSLDDMTVTEDGGTWDSSLDSCLHVYRVDSPPNFTTASLLWKPFNDALRYWGVFKAGGADPTYTMVYHYDGYPITGSENNLQMAYRRHNCEQWKGLNATLNTTTKTLTKEGLSGTEFILGADVDPRNTINYDGTNDYVGISDEASLRLTTDGSLEAWVYISAAQTDGIIYKVDTSGTNPDGYSLTVNASGNVLFSLYESTGPSSTIVTSATTLNTAIWYHIAATWDGTDMNLYINGVLDPNSQASTQAAGDTTGTDLTIASDTTNYFNGRIDEVRIWDEARSQGDIRTYMCQKIDTRDPNLVGYWRFDEETTSDTSFDFGTVPYNFATMYNFGTATGIITARVCSEAPIGDRSAYSYGSTASATVTHPDGDYFTATKFAGDWGTTFSGLHAYQVDGVPVYPPDISGPLPYNPYLTPNGLTPPIDPDGNPLTDDNWSSIDYTRYWGVFTTDWTTTNQPTYDVIYNYGTVGNGNPNVPDEADPSDPNDPQIGLAYRPTYCYGTWTDSSANWAFGTRQLELLGANSKQQSQNSPSKTNPEYVLGGKNQPLAISLASFTASVADGCINIFWETATEIDTVGFQLWRSESKNGVYELVPYSYTRSKSVTETRGAAYAFTDCSVVLDGKTDYYYKLEEIDTDTAKNNPFYGPIGPVKETISASQVNTGKASSGSNCFIGALQ